MMIYFNMTYKLGTSFLVGYAIGTRLVRDFEDVSG
jgi:hypothetical protein